MNDIYYDDDEEIIGTIENPLTTEEAYQFGISIQSVQELERPIE